MSTNSTSLNRTLRALRASVLVASLAMLGLVGCSSGDGSGGGGGSTAKSSAGQNGGSGGASGALSSQGSSSSAKGGSSSYSSSAGSGGGGQSSGGTSSAGGSVGGSSKSFSTIMSGGCPSTCIGGTSGGTSSKGGTGGTATGGTGGTATGGTATGGTATGGSSGGQDGGAGTGGSNSSSPDAGVDRTPDTSAPNPDTGSTTGDFCPSTGACAIMPLGDSITDGMGSSGGGYRLPLFKLALTDSKNITFVGRNINGPASFSFNGQTKQFPQGHEGYSGWTIQDGGGRSGIYGKVDGAIQTNMPHIVTLMIGTNDVNISLDLTNAPKRLGELLDKIIADAPKALIVVAKLVPTTNDTTNGRVRTYNDGIATVVQSRITAGKNLKMVDMYAAFTANTSYKTALMNDELHPKDAGYSVMAQTWYDAIKSYLH